MSHAKTQLRCLPLLCRSSAGPEGHMNMWILHSRGKGPRRGGFQRPWFVGSLDLRTILPYSIYYIPSIMFYMYIDVSILYTIWFAGSLCFCCVVGGAELVSSRSHSAQAEVTEDDGTHPGILRDPRDHINISVLVV